MSSRVDRSHWIGGVTRSFEEMQLVDLDWWLALSPTERIALVTQLSEEADWSRYAAQEDLEEGATTRLLGPLGGIRRM